MTHIGVTCTKVGLHTRPEFMRVTGSSIRQPASGQVNLAGACGSTRSAATSLPRRAGPSAGGAPLSAHMVGGAHVLWYGSCRLLDLW